VLEMFAERWICFQFLAEESCSSYLLLIRSPDSDCKFLRNGRRLEAER
jgi:hypothetical protein